jgi:hypothetical protein
MNYILQYDAELDLDFEIPELDASLDELLSDLVLNSNHEIRTALAAALSHGIGMGYDHVPVFAVKGSEFIFVLHEEEYGIQLDKCITYFSDIEEYETCAHLQKLKS